VFTDQLKPLTIGDNETSVDNNNATTTTPNDSNMTSNIDQLEARLTQLRDDIASRATPNEVMTTAHLNIHPLLMQMYGLTIAPQEGEEHADH
jgi:hypothetical protein